MEKFAQHQRNHSGGESEFEGLWLATLHQQARSCRKAPSWWLGEEPAGC